MGIYKVSWTCSLQGVTIILYLDDWLLVSSFQAKAEQGIKHTLSLLSSLGLQVNFSKTTLWPTQQVTYIGAVLDSVQGCAFLPREREVGLCSLLQFFLPGAFVTVHLAQHLLGLMASTMAVVQCARLKMQSLQAWYLTFFNSCLLYTSPSPRD